LGLEKIGGLIFKYTQDVDAEIEKKLAVSISASQDPTAQGTSRFQLSK
jgi:hypothetical protein